MVKIESVPQESYIDTERYEADKSRSKKIGKQVAGLFRLRLIGERLRKYAPKDMDPAGLELTAQCEPQDDEWFRRRGRDLVKLTIAWPGAEQEQSDLEIMGYVDAHGVFATVLPEVVDDSEADDPIEAVEGYFIPGEDEDDPSPKQAIADREEAEVISDEAFNAGIAAIVNESSLVRNHTR